MNPSFLKVMYFVNLVIGIVFVSSLRPFFGLGCLVMVSSAMGHFEPSLPVITENEQFIGPESSIPTFLGVRLSRQVHKVQKFWRTSRMVRHGDLHLAPFYGGLHIPSW